MRNFDIRRAKGVEILRQLESTLNGALFITAVSFESRCVQGLVEAIASGKMAETVFIHYDTRAYPTVEDASLRRAHSERMKSVVTAQACPQEDVYLDAYAVRPFVEQLRASIERTSPTTVAVDITCLSKVHAIAIAGLAASYSDECDFVFCYTAPRAYRSMAARSSVGWRDTIVVPVGRSPRLRREGHARGIILAGHEADRLSVACSYLEPAAGRIIVACARGRPDFTRVALKVNREMFDRLERLRMPRGDSAGTVDDGWSLERVELGDFVSLSVAIASEIELARVDRAPILLFPFGPKSQVLAAALQLGSQYEGPSWAVYPIPFSYDVDYTSGIGHCTWMKVVPRGGDSAIGECSSSDDLSGK